LSVDASLPNERMLQMRLTEGLRKQFAVNLRSQRERVGMSQEALADACNLHRTEISLLERCKRSPRLETIVVLARALQLESPAVLLDGIH
jgi:transcriptional regulator with XRE-family HTH domain